MASNLKVAHDAIKLMCTAQKELTVETGNETKRTFNHEDNNEELRAQVKKDLYEKAYAVYNKKISVKSERSAALKEVVTEYLESRKDEEDLNTGLIKKYYHDVEKDAARNMVLNESVRMDGRAFNEIRPIWSEVDYLPMPHGSAVFTRGETQAITSVTLGTKLDQQIDYP